MYWLMATKRCNNVWKVSKYSMQPLPENIARRLGIDQEDSDIDLVGEIDGNYIAVKCIYYIKIIDVINLHKFSQECVRLNHSFNNFMIISNKSTMDILAFLLTDKYMAIGEEIFEKTKSLEWVNMITLLNRKYIEKETGAPKSPSIEEMRQKRMLTFSEVKAKEK